MNKHAVFSFFSGAGFLDLGFEDAGFDVVFVNEINPDFMFQLATTFKTTAGVSTERPYREAVYPQDQVHLIEQST